MFDLNRVYGFIDEVNQKCDEIITLKKKAEALYKKEKAATDAEGKKLIADMQISLERYCENHFDTLFEKLSAIEKLMSKDYSEVLNGVKVNVAEFDKSTIEECNAVLVKIIQELNAHITTLNSVDFEELVPPVKVKVENDVLYTYIETVGDMSSYTYDDDTGEFSQKILQPEIDSKPLVKLVQQITELCKRGILCVEKMKGLYSAHIDVISYEKFVQESVESWNAERKNQIDNECASQCYKIFNSNEAKEKYGAFFDDMYSSARKAEVDYRTGTLTDSEEIVIGSTRMTVTESKQHKDILAESEPFKKCLKNGELIAPVILDLKKCGNILLELSELDEYGHTVSRFIEHIILKFLLAFPANKIKFRLIDTRSKVDFSPFNQLVKINPDLLMDGIIRDNRKLENVIKDMKELMHNIGDKKLSVNDVSNIFEYNKAFETNPQTYHLLVLTDFPNGIQEDLAQDVLEIIKNGNKAGIFTLLIHNTSVEQSNYQKEYAFDKIINNIKKHALCLSQEFVSLSVNLDIDNTFEIDNEPNINLLPQIVEVMQNNAEQTKQKNVLLETMFGETDRASQSAKGIPLAAEVLDIPIGVRGGEIQTLKLETNNGSPHAVVIGGTGSGKSVLLHTIILNTCYRYSQEDVNLYLLDFKGGNEFKFYEANKDASKQLPHIKLLGITSNVEDGIAILNNLLNVLKERQELFAKANAAKDIVAYCKAGHKLPRLFVIIDEIQVLFEQDDKLTQKAIEILGKLFREGRSYGINLLWASQNVPHVVGLDNQVINHVGNKISLKLNNPDNANEIGIDPKVVSALNRPEKGLGVIMDNRTGNSCVEFRAAYSEEGEKRQAFVQQIIDKWHSVEPDNESMFIFGNDEPPVPTEEGSVFSVLPKRENVVSKAFESYAVQFGQNYITGKPFNIDINLGTNKSNIAFMGTDVETVRDMMGYSLLSIVMEHMTNADCIAEPTSIYYANGEGIIPKNAADLFNAVKQNFAHVVENVSSVARFKETVAKLYKSYKARREETDQSDEKKGYTPYFFVIHSLQKYIDLFESNPLLQLDDKQNTYQENDYVMNAGNSTSVNFPVDPFASSSHSSAYAVPNSNNSSSVFFVDAFKELMARAGQYGIHFIISLDNPEAIRSIREELHNITYKVFTKGINSSVISQIIGGYSNNVINNPELSLVAIQDEKYKVRMYRYDEKTDANWYKPLAEKYLDLR